MRLLTLFVALNSALLATAQFPGGFINDVSNFFNGAKDKVQNTVPQVANTVGNAVGNTVGTAINGAKSAAEVVANTAKTGAETVGNQMNKFGNTVSDTLFPKSNANGNQPLPPPPSQPTPVNPPSPQVYPVNPPNPQTNPVVTPNPVLMPRGRCQCIKCKQNAQKIQQEIQQHLLQQQQQRNRIVTPQEQVKKVQDIPSRKQIEFIIKKGGQLSKEDNTNNHKKIVNRFTYQKNEQGQKLKIINLRSQHNSEQISSVH